MLESLLQVNKNPHLQVQQRKSMKEYRLWSILGTKVYCLRSILLCKIQVCWSPGIWNNLPSRFIVCSVCAIYLNCNVLPIVFIWVSSISGLNWTIILMEDVLVWALLWAMQNIFCPPPPYWPPLLYSPPLLATRGKSEMVLKRSTPCLTELLFTAAAIRLPDSSCQLNCK